MSDLMTWDDFEPLADGLIIRCPVCGVENKYSLEDQGGASWACCGVTISIPRKELERIANSNNCATAWRYYGGM